MPDTQALQIFYGSIPVIVAIFIALMVNNQRLADLGKRIDDQGKRIDSLENSLSKRIDDLRAYMDGQIVSLREFIRSEIRRLEERIERIERPIVRG